MSDAIIESMLPATIEDADEDDGMEEVVNISGNVVKFVIDNSKVTLRPGGRIRINRAYAIGQKSSPNRDARSSAIDMMTNGMVVVSSDPRAPRLPQTAPAKAVS